LRVWATRNWVRLEHGAIVVLNAGPLQALAEAGSENEDP
jgi:CRP/FNR family cyclic AMP-dependent transcriptional regulator